MTNLRVLRSRKLQEMITKTFTYAAFLFNDEPAWQYRKNFEHELKYFSETQINVDLEVFLTELLSHQTLIIAEKIDEITIFHTVFYDFQCNTEFPPKVVRLLNDLNATFCITAQKVGEMNLYTVLDKMRERPAMYLGAASLTALSSFIDGFREGCNYENSEEPSFDKFNDFIGNHYGKYTTAGWKNLILANHFGNEEEAIKLFFELLDEFRQEENRPSSRDIIYRLLHVAMLDFRAEDEHNRQSQIADLLQHLSNQLKETSKNGYSFEYDNILQNIFERANGNNYLHHWIKANAPETTFYEYELWHGDDGGCKITTVLRTNHQQKDIILDKCEVLIKTFFAINHEEANKVKEGFLGIL